MGSRYDPSPLRSRSRYARTGYPSYQKDNFYRRSPSRSFSRGRSPIGRRHAHRRSNSRSPFSSRKRHVGDRDRPQPSRVLGVFGLNLSTQERDLRDVFSRFGRIADLQVVHDRKTGRSRGFAFIYFESPEDARSAKETLNGADIDGNKIRIDFSITKRAHTPTPGIYLGRPTVSDHFSYGRGGHGRGNSGGGGGRFYEQSVPYGANSFDDVYRSGYGGSSRSRRSPSYTRSSAYASSGWVGNHSRSRSRSRSRSYYRRNHNADRQYHYHSRSR